MTKHTPRAIAKTWAAAVAATAIAAAAFAQEIQLGADAPSGAEMSAPATGAIATRGIEEIVVTARKREESLQDVPVAVTAFSGEQLARYGVSDLTELGQMTPQLFISDAPTGNSGSLTIRGIGSNQTSAGFDQAVSIYLDGLQYDKGDILAQGYLDLARVEVLKGPQALFFGKNNSAGVVSLVSADPGAEPEWIGRYGHEFYANENWYEAIGSGPITDTFLARLALRYSTLGGYVENLAPEAVEVATGETVPPPKNRDWPGKDEFLGRLTLKYEPINDLDLRLKVGGANLKMAGASQNSEPFSCKALGRSQLEAGEDCHADRKIRQNDVPPMIAATEPSLSEENGALFNKYNAYNLVLTASYDLEGSGIPAELTSVSGYTRFNRQALYDVDFTATSLFFGSEIVGHRSVSEELRLLTAFDFPVNALFGGYYQNAAYSYESPDLRLVPLPADPSTGRYITLARSSATDGYTASAFGQFIWNVTKTIEISPGARYSHVVKDSYLVNDYFHPATAELWRPAGDRLVGNFSDDDLSPEITATWRPEWRPDSDLAIYAAYKRGFKAGGLSNNALARVDTPPEDVLFESERVSGFEGGIKSTWFDRALRANVVGYGYEFTDLQVNFFDSTDLAFSLQNAAEATTTGGEVEIEWLPRVDGLSLHGSLSYNIARYGDFLSFCYTGQSSANGCNLDDAGRPTSGIGTRQDLSDTPTPLAPPWAATMGFMYEGDLIQFAGRSFGFAVNADSSYTDNYLFSPIGRRDIIQNSFFRTDASLRFFEEDGSWELALIGRNLSNEYYYAIASFDSPGTGAATGTSAAVLGDQVGIANRPREVAVELIGRF